MKGTSMPRIKSDSLTIRINPVVKEALRRASRHDHRSIGNLIEVLVLDHCRKIKVEIPELAQKSDDRGKAKKSVKSK